MGLTKSVQPYWRLAIATIPTMPIISWTHRAPDAGLATTDCDAGPMLILLHGGSTARLGMFCTTASQGGNGRRVDSSSGALSWQADPVHSISASQFQSALGSDAVNQLAARMGISPDAMSAKRAEVLRGAQSTSSRPTASCRRAFPRQRYHMDS